MEKEVKYHTPEQAYLKVRDWCALQERCQQEVRDKLYGYGLKTTDVENLIVRLIDENFINEERFAMAFAGGKFRIKKWGRVKIKQALKAHRISDYCIQKALAQIDDATYSKTLKGLLDKKAAEIKESSPIQEKYKLLRYALSKGYEQNRVFDLLNEE